MRCCLFQPGGAAKVDWSKIVSEWSNITSEPYEAECLQTSYYGVKRVVAVLLPLLRLSDHPIIVNVSSSMGKLKNIRSERIRGIFDDIENLTEEKLDNVLDEFLKDLKHGVLESKGWPSIHGRLHFILSSLEHYARILAERCPNVCLNSVCTGYVKTDINYNTGVIGLEDGAASVVRLALHEKGASSGCFFFRLEESDH